MTKRFLTDNEKKLWEEINKGTERLKPERVDTSSPTQTTSHTIKPSPTPALLERKITHTPKPLVQKPTSDIDSLDKNTLRKIRTNTRSIDATLDLHGFSQDEAFEYLKNFIERAQSRGHKTLLIITGKGENYTTKLWNKEFRSVLRKNVPIWLKNKTLFPNILSISTAHKSHGGEGAYYVFLRKRR